MRFPGYLLNPGDMFQVEPDQVLFATGEKKAMTSRRRRAQKAKSGEEAATSEEQDSVDQGREDDLAFDGAQEELAEEPTEGQGAAESDEGGPDEDTLATTKKTLLSLRDRTKAILDDPSSKKQLSGKQKQGLRELAKSLKRLISRPANATPSAIDEFETQLSTWNSILSRKSSKPTASEEALAADAEPKPSDDSIERTPEMEEAMQLIRENRPDPRKSYKTPWRPRPWMSAFAFIPRYLEVNQNICSAVYLRHPVCYPGFAEVPTPFDPETLQLAFNWYLRRR